MLGAGYRYLSSSGAIWEGAYASAPLLFGINVRERDQVVLGVRGGWQRWYSSGAHTVDVPQVGASLGYRWAATARLTVLPEVSWMYTPVHLGGIESQTYLLHFGVGFFFSGNTPQF